MPAIGLTLLLKILSTSVFLSKEVAYADDLTYLASLKAFGNGGKLLQCMIHSLVIMQML